MIPKLFCTDCGEEMELDGILEDKYYVLKCPKKRWYNLHDKIAVDFLGNSFIIRKSRIT